MIQEEISMTPIYGNKQAQWATMIMTEGISMFPPFEPERKNDVMERVMNSRTGFRADRPVNDFTAICVNLKMYFLIEEGIFSTYGWRE